MKHFFGIILLILLQINNNGSFATNTKNSKVEISNSESFNVENALFQLTEDTVTKNFVNAAPSIMITCVNTSVTLTNTAIPGNSCSNLANYVWDFGDGFTVVSTQLTSPQSKTHTYSTPGLYHVTLKATNGCGTLTNSIDICVEPPPVPTFNLNVTQGCAPLTVNATNTTNTTAICSTPNYSWDVTYTPGNCGTAAAYTYLGGSGSSSASPTFQFTNPGIYTIKLAVTNFCGTYYNTQTVEVKQPPIVSINNIPDFCETATINPTATVTSCSPLNALTYAWSFPGGSPSFSTNANPTNITYSSPGNYTVLLNVTNECGVSVTDSKTFTVKNAPKVTNSPLSQTVCSGFLTSQVNLTADISGTTFSWTATATPGVSGFIPSGTTNVLPPQTLSTTGTTAGTVTYAITPFFNGCTGPTVNYVVTVNPAPVFTLQPLPSTLCLNGIPTNLAVAISPIADTPLYQWYASGIAIPGATNPVYTPSTNTVGTTSYYCIVSFSSGACADIQSNTVNVTVAPPPTISSQPASLQNICVGGSSLPLSVNYSGGVGVASFQWYSNTSNSNVGGSAISGATSSVYTPPAFTVAGNYYYYAVVTLSGSNCGSAISNPAQIKVVADPVISSQPMLTQTVCQGSIPTTIGVTATGGTGSFIYQWYQNSTSSNVGGTLISGASNSTFTPPTTVTGTNYYYCEVSQSGLNCSVTSTTSEVVVNLQPSVVNQPVSSTICVGGTPTGLTVSTVNGVGTPTYQWYSNTVNNTTSGTPIGGAISANYSPSGAVVGTTYYYCVITFPLGGCNLVTSNTATVVVNSLPTISSHPTALQDICVGGSIGTPLAVGYSGGAGTASYQWYSNTSNSNIGGTAIVGATNSTYTPPVFTVVGNYYYYAVVTLSGSNCGSATSNPAQINVVADPVVTTHPLSTQTVCQTSTPTTINVTASGGTGTFLYQWYQNTTNSNIGGTLIAGATGSSFAPSTALTGTTYYYCSISQTGLNCNVTSNTSEVVVNPSPSFSSQPVSQSICIGGTLTTLSVSTAGGVGAPTYQWYSNTINNTSTGTLIPTAIGATYSPSGAVVSTTYYYCIATFAMGGCNMITSNTAEIIVASLPTINLHPTPLQDICVGGTIGTPLSVGYTGGAGTPSYQWYSNTVSSTIGGVAIVGATTSTYLPPVMSSVGHYYYYAIVTLSGSNCGFATSNVADVNVVADPTVSVQPLSTQTVCQGAIPATMSVTATGGLGTFSYQWYHNTTNSNAGGTLISGATNSTYVPSTATAGTTYYYCLISQTGLNCAVTSSTSEVIVNPQPTFTSQPVSSTICVLGLPLQLSVSTINGVGAPTYQWYSNTVNNNTTGTPIGGATSINYNPSGAVAGTTYYYCEVTFAAGCNVITSNTATVTVIPSPSINVQPMPLQEICAGDAIGAPLSVSYINGVGTPSYQWFSNTVNSSVGGTAIAGAINATYTPPPFPVSGNYYFYVEVILSGNGCVPAISNVAQVIVDANPTLTPQLVPTQTVCINTIPQTLSITASGGLGAYTYQWYQNTVNNSTGGTPIAGALSSTYVPSTASLGTLYYYCIVKSSLGANCGVTSDVATVTVNPEPTFTSQPVSSVVCVGGTPAPLSVTYKDGAGTPSYQWYSNTLNNNTTGTLIALATSSTYNPPSALAATTYYYCVITMAPGGCTTLVSNVAQVVVNPNPVITSFNTEICNGTAFSIIPQDVTNGIVPAGTTYTWSMPTISPVGSVSGATAQPIAQIGISQTLTNTTTGIATVTYKVTPLSGACPGPDFNVVVTVDPTIVPTVTVQNISCFGIVDGSLTASIAGGIPPYSLSWTGPSGFTSNSSALTNLYAGNYTLTVTDSKSCQVTSTYTIVEPADIKITTDIHKNVTFFGADNAIVGITVTGGTPPYNYAWTKNGVAFATTEDLSNIGPGYYEVTVTDSHSCAPKYAFYDVTVPPALIVSLVSKVDLNCFGDNYGAITVDVVGGTPIQVSPGVFDYTYSWAGPNGFTSTSKNLTNLVAGTYVLNVTDNSGFSKQLTVVVTQPTPILVNFSSTPKLDCATKVVSELTTAHVSGGIPPYNLVWSRGTISGLNKEIMESSQAGPVTLQITDGNGCVVDTTLNLSIKPIGIDHKVLDCDKHSYQFDALVLDTLSTYTYKWDFGDGTTDINKTVNHIFATTGNKTVQLTITSPACTINFSQVIAVEAPPVLTLDRDTKICIGDSTIIHVSGAATYLWNDNSKSDSIMINRTGEYSVTGTSATGCTTTLKFMVSNYNLYNYTIQTNKNEVSVTSPTVRFWSESYAGSQYTWDFGDGKTDHGNNLDHTFDITNEKTFNVTLKAIDPDGCTEYATKQIIVVNSAMYNTFTPNGDGIDDVFLKSWHIKVYNRNSILIYDGTDGWDGTYKGKPVSNDTYFFVVYYASESGTKTNSGYVTVVR